MIERRQYERVGFLCKATLTTHPGGTAVPARSLDISLGGVGVVTQASFAPGQTVWVSFFLRDRSQKEVVERVLGRVVNLRADVEANRVGVEFLEPLQEARNPLLVKKVLSA